MTTEDIILHIFYLVLHHFRAIASNFAFKTAKIEFRCDCPVGFRTCRLAEYNQIRPENITLTDCLMYPKCSKNV
jgi:hypothetical protein